MHCTAVHIIYRILPYYKTIHNTQEEVNNRGEVAEHHYRTCELRRRRTIHL